MSCPGVVKGRSALPGEPAEWVAKALEAGEGLALSPAEALYCGDTVIDAQTAAAAGTRFCAVLNGTTPAEAFRDLPHVRIAPDLIDLRTFLGV